MAAAMNLSCQPAERSSDEWRAGLRHPRPKAEDGENLVDELSKRAAQIPAPAELLSPAVSEFLGPAAVIEVRADGLYVELEGAGRAKAEMALAYPYRPVVGDVLLVIGRDERHYVIGVLNGKGDAELAFRGNVSLRAIDGTLDLTGDRGVSIRGRAVELSADTLRVVADAVTEKFNTALTRVRELMTTHAGEARTVVRGQWLTQSKRGQIQTEETMSINGKAIHLG